MKLEPFEVDAFVAVTRGFDPNVAYMTPPPTILFENTLEWNNVKNPGEIQPNATEVDLSKKKKSVPFFYI